MPSVPSMRLLRPRDNVSDSRSGRPRSQSLRMGSMIFSVPLVIFCVVSGHDIRRENVQSPTDSTEMLFDLL